MPSKRVTPNDAEFDENPEWTEADFNKAKPASEMLSAELYRALGEDRGAARKSAHGPKDETAS